MLRATPARLLLFACVALFAGGLLVVEWNAIHSADHSAGAAGGSFRPGGRGGNLRPAPASSSGAPSLALDFPRPADARHGQCREASHDLDALPSVSLVIPFLNEQWEHIRITVGSIIEHTPERLLDEVLFIDDGNEEGMRHRRLPDLHPKVRVHRNLERAGLIRCKIIGAALTQSPVIVFMEPHCIVQRGWLPPLLAALSAPGAEKNVAVPVLDIITENNFSDYVVADTFIGGFDWSMNFNWDMTVAQRNASYVPPEPYSSPALSGGILAIRREWWEQSGTYDVAMAEWGGEHVEMSLRTWRCGGRILMVPCARIAHMFRAASPYTRHADAMFRNSKRVAVAWLEEYLEIFYQASPYMRRVEAGDVRERVALKERLKCRSMQWYLDNVFPELKGKPPLGQPTGVGTA